MDVKLAITTIDNLIPNEIICNFITTYLKKNNFNILIKDEIINIPLRNPQYILLEKGIFKNSSFEMGGYFQVKCEFREDNTNDRSFYIGRLTVLFDFNGKHISESFKRF